MSEIYYSSRLRDRVNNSAVNTADRIPQNEAYESHGVKINVLQLTSNLAGYYQFPEGTIVGEIDFTPDGAESAPTDPADAYARYVALFDGLSGFMDQVASGSIACPDVIYGDTNKEMAAATTKFGFTHEDISPAVRDPKKKLYQVTGVPYHIRGALRQIAEKRTANGRSVLDILRTKATARGASSAPVKI